MPPTIARLPTRNLYASFMRSPVKALGPFTGLGPRLKPLKRSFAMDLIYILCGVAIFVGFGLYAMLLKRV